MNDHTSQHTGLYTTPDGNDPGCTPVPPAPETGGGGGSSGEGGEGGRYIAEGENLFQIDPNASTTGEELRAKFGLTPRVLAGIRQLELREGEHWKKEGRVICYTAEGVELLRDRLALVEKKGAPDPPPAPPEPAVVVPPMSIKLTRVRLPNTRIVLGREAGADPDTPIVRVRVKTSVNLRIGMVLKDCHPVDVENGLWEFRTRLPRFPGKW